MKILKNILVFTIAIAFAAACNEGIDPITSVSPGVDETAPTVAINYPTQGDLIKIAEGAEFAIDLDAADDIELESVSIIMDGTEVANITNFMDYRRYAPIGGYTLADIQNGTHTLKLTATDLTGKSTSTPEITFDILKMGSFVATYGEIFYMSFDNHLMELATLSDATMVGTSGYGTGKIGGAYAGATDAYLTFPTDGLINSEFSATFWYNVNASPDRSGILTISPPGINTRTSGFRLFREGSTTDQIIKLNVGDNSIDAWFDGGAAATIQPDNADWVHIAFTISTTHVALYIDGVLVSEGDFGPIGWTDCDMLSIGSGEPRFVEWGHKSDLSLYDELRIFDKALTQQEIQTIINAEQ